MVLIVGFGRIWPGIIFIATKILKGVTASVQPIREETCQGSALGFGVFGSLESS